MKREFLYANNSLGFDQVKNFLDKGWILDPLFGSKPLRMDSAIAFPLVFYESEEEKPKLIVEEASEKEFEDVVSLKDVPNVEVNALLSEGYKIYQIFSKNTVLLKRQPKDDPRPVVQLKEVSQ